MLADIVVIGSCIWYIVGGFATFAIGLKGGCPATELPNSQTPNPKPAALSPKP